MSGAAAREPQNIDELELDRLRTLRVRRKVELAKEKLAAEKVEEANEELKEKVTKRTPHDVKWLLKKMRGDPNIWFKFWWDIKLSDKQFDLVDSMFMNRHTVGVFSRQSGKTFGVAGGKGHDLVLVPGKNIGLYAPTQNQAINVGFGTLMGLFQSQPILYRQISEVKKSGYLKMNNGNEFRAHTANKDSNIRGFSPTDIWCDESQDINDETYHADILGSGGAVKGITASGGRDKAIYTSIVETLTPKGRNHAFKTVRPLPQITYATLKNGKIDIPGAVVRNMLAPSGAYVVWQPFWESPIIDLEWLDQRRQVMAPSLFQQEYACAFNSNDGFAFNIDHVYRAAKIEQRVFKPLHNSVYVAGVDLGRNQDHTVMTVLRVYDNNWREMVFHNQWDLREDWRMIFADILQYLGEWNPKLTLVDETGIGDPIYSEVFKRSRFTTQGWIYNQERKNEIIRDVEKDLEHEALGLWDLEDLVWQLRDLPMVISESGRPKYPKPDGGHDDRVQSLALACKAANIFVGHGMRMMTVQDNQREQFFEFIDNSITPDIDPKTLRKQNHKDRVKFGGRQTRGKVNFREMFQLD